MNERLVRLGLRGVEAPPNVDEAQEWVGVAKADEVSLNKDISGVLKLKGK